jgi:hypothetical protein
MSFEIRQEAGFYLLDFPSVVGKKMVISAYSSLLKQKSFNTKSHTLWDFRESIVDLSMNDINEVAQAVTSAGDQRSDKARSAFITSDPSDTAILQTYITATAHYPVEFRLFDDYQQGIDWLMA